jgi:hypothetical protein
LILDYNEEDPNIGKISATSETINFGALFKIEVASTYNKYKLLRHFLSI